MPNNIKVQKPISIGKYSDYEKLVSNDDDNNVNSVTISLSTFIF